MTKIDSSYLPVLIILSLKWLAWCWRLPGSLHGVWPAGWWHFGSLGSLLFIRGLPVDKTGNMGISRSHNPLDHNSCAQKINFQSNVLPFSCTHLSLCIKVSYFEMSFWCFQFFQTTNEKIRLHQYYDQSWCSRS